MILIEDEAHVALLLEAMLDDLGAEVAGAAARVSKALEADLTQEERDVLLHHGTEAPFCGGLLDNKEAGVYGCRLCGLPLFRSDAKFESGTGWPSFFKPFDDDHMKLVRDTELMQ